PYYLPCCPRLMSASITPCPSLMLRPPPAFPLFPYTTLFRSLLALLTAQVVMVSLMTMTPVHIEHQGGSLTIVGHTISLHVAGMRSEEHTSELQSRFDLVCRLLLENKNRLRYRGDWRRRRTGS